LGPFCVSMNGDEASSRRVIHSDFGSHSPLLRSGDRGYDGAPRIQPRHLGNGHIIFSTQHACQEDREQAGLIQAYSRHHTGRLKGLQSRVGRERQRLTAQKGLASSGHEQDYFRRTLHLTTHLPCMSHDLRAVKWMCERKRKILKEGPICSLLHAVPRQPFRPEMLPMVFQCSDPAHSV
jgi:hypothetical protein